MQILSKKQNKTYFSKTSNQQFKARNGNYSSNKELDAENTSKIDKHQHELAYIFLLFKCFLKCIIWKHTC